MGFTTLALASTAVSAAGSFMGSQAQRAQSKQLNQVANVQEETGKQRAAVITNVAMENARRQMRNAESENAHARRDAATSNLVSEGSVTVREQDLATRLQDDINAAANQALQEASAERWQSQLNAWDTRNSARAMKRNSYSTAISGIGSVFGNLSKIG